MDTVGYILSYITPYFALTVFVAGIAYQLYRWSQRKPVTAHMSLFPRPEGRGGRLLEALIDMFTLKGLFRVNKPLWTGGFIMHIGLLLLLAGHVRVATDYYFLWDLIGWGEKELEIFTAVAGVTAGLLFMLPFFYLLPRRWAGSVKWLSSPEDYFVLVLLFTIGATGMHMRSVLHVEQDAMRGFMQGLFKFRWQPVPESAGASFIWHFALVQLLMIYFPFSKLMHTIGSIFSKMVVKS